jgi:predicted DNA-binding protein
MPKRPELRPIMVRLPEQLRQRLSELAKNDGRSMNAEIIHRLEQAIEGPPTTERLGTIENTLRRFAGLLDAQRKVMEEQSKWATVPRDLSGQIRGVREDLQQMRKELEQIRQWVDDQVAAARHGEPE